MLAKKRQEEILAILKKNGSVTVQELTEAFNASESTIRRDITELDHKGKLSKVFGGAVSRGSASNLHEDEVSKRRKYKFGEKESIGRYGASLIKPGDFVYIDAGTTTGSMLHFITEKSAVYVTNAASHALEMSKRGLKVILIGGELKASTEAVVGAVACENLRSYNFTKSFMGSNGIDKRAGLTTPDAAEAMVKRAAIEQSTTCYVLCTSEKFRQICPIQFAKLEDVVIITDKQPGGSYQNNKGIIVVEEANN